MHHYRHHIGDFRSATTHLSDLEELAYRRMIELYYDTETPLPTDVAWVARRVKSTPEVVQRVLDDFFVSSDGGWRQSRCDEELADYRKACKLARSNGKRGGRPRKPTATGPEPGGNPVGFSRDPERVPDSPQHGGRVESSPTPNPQYPVPQPPIPSTQSPSPKPPAPSEGRGIASLEAGIGERGCDPREREAIFALLGATPLRSNSRNRRQILDEIAGAVASDGMGSDQARRLIAKARAETKGDYAGLLSQWFLPGAWREKWDEIVSGRASGIVARIAAKRRVQ